MEDMKKMTWIATMAMLAALALAPFAMANEKVLFELDFESPDAAEFITSKGVILSESGPESKHCMSRTAVSQYNSINLKTDIQAEEGLVLSFDFRTEVRAGQLNWLGIYLMTSDGKKMIHTVKPSTAWTSVAAPLTTFRIDTGSKVKERIQAGETISAIQFYGRGADKTADQTVYIDNVKVFVK